MEQNKLGSYVYQLTNLAVLVGLIFVGLEIRQNNLFARSEVRNDIVVVGTEILREGLDPFANEIITKSRTGVTLEPNEIIWMETLYNIYLRFYENIYYQYGLGLIDDGQMEIFTGQLELSWACNNRFLAFYQSNSDAYQSGYRNELNQIFESVDCK